MRSPRDPVLLHRECRTKLAWAHKRLGELDSDVVRWVQSLEQGKTYDVVAERDPSDTYYIHRLRVYVAAPALRWRLMAGDVVHNMRSSLDNMVEALTIRYSGKSMRSTEFPIFIDEDSFLARRKSGGASGLRKLRGVSPTARALIEAAQPYKRGHFHVRHALWTLNELWNADKHRVPTVVALGVIPVSFKADVLLLDPNTPSPPQGELRVNRNLPFVDGAVVATSKIRGRDAEVVVSGEGAFRIAFENVAPGYGQDVVILLAQLMDWVSVLFKNLRPEFGGPPPPPRFQLMTTFGGVEPIRPVPPSKG